MGDMAELAEVSAQWHAEVGRYAAAAGIDALYTVGSLTEHCQRGFAGEGQHFSGRSALVEFLETEL